MNIQADSKPNLFSPETFLDSSLLIFAVIGIAGFTLIILLIFSVWFIKYRKRKGYYSKSMHPLSSTSRLYSVASAPLQSIYTIQATSTLVTLTQDNISIPA
jgi:hypothetical protein